MSYWQHVDFLALNVPAKASKQYLFWSLPRISNGRPNILAMKQSRPLERKAWIRGACPIKTDIEPELNESDPSSNAILLHHQTQGRIWNTMSSA